MQFEVIRKSHKKEIIVGAVVLVLTAVVIVVRSSFAKYQTIKSLKIAEGTINYKVPDFKVMAMYKNDGAGDTPIDTMPELGYIINTEKSYCTTDNVNKVYNKVFTNEDGKHIITGLSKDSKCYIYFDKEVKASDTILAGITVKTGTPNFGAVATTNEGVYKAKDESGEYSYYFRGAVTNNYVKFANKYWRIIRINGDGSVRLIYDGTSAHANGTSTSDSIAISNQKFNSSYNDNIYVGFKYTNNQIHGLSTKSNVLSRLEVWYDNNLASYANKLDTNAGFCGDRTPSTSDSIINNEGGTGTTMTYYGAYIRLVNSTKSPSLECLTEDFYTVNGTNKGNKSLEKPIGLISADEVSMAGGLRGTANKSYYLNNGQNYWTMTPSDYMNINYGGEMFIVAPDGILVNWVYGCSTQDVRPVINLKANTKFTYNNESTKGTMNDPYVVE